MVSINKIPFYLAIYLAPLDNAKRKIQGQAIVRFRKKFFFISQTKFHIRNISISMTGVRLKNNRQHSST
jgi:hypothetical protein